jgi:hypothetical protein
MMLEGMASAAMKVERGSRRKIRTTATTSAVARSMSVKTDRTCSSM